MVGLFICLVLSVEISGVLWTYWTQDRLVYVAPTVQVGETPNSFPVPGFFIHPYIGFALSPGRTGEAREKYEGVWQGRKWRVNNAGFSSTMQYSFRNYPYEAAENEIIVGIFGGSVGTGTALSAHNSDIFSKNPPSAWAGKKVTVLNFSVSGYRQPQQLFTFQYFVLIGQHFDAVINIDGFNETVTSPKNNSENAEWSYPADSLWGATTRQLEAVARRQQDSRANWLEQGLGAANAYLRSCRFGLCVIWGETLKSAYRFGPRAGAAEVLDPQKTLFPVAPYAKPADEKRLFDELGNLWVASSISMSDFAKRIGVAYVHVLQPNQWDRRFGAYDPIDPKHPYGWVIDWVNMGYKVFRERIPVLQSAGVHAVDASGIFAGEPWRKNYSDDCCHYTEEGYHRLHLRMIRAISDQLDGRLPPK